MIFLEATLVAKCNPVLLRATNPPSRAVKAGARPHACVRAALVAVRTLSQPAQSGFSALRRLSAGKVFVFQFRPCSAPLGIRRWRCGGLPFGPSAKTQIPAPSQT